MKLTDPRYEFDVTNLLFFSGMAGLIVALLVVMLAYAAQNTTWEVRLLVLGLLALEGVLVLAKRLGRAQHNRNFERAWREGLEHERSGVE